MSKKWLRRGKGGGKGERSLAAQSSLWAWQWVLATWQKSADLRCSGCKHVAAHMCVLVGGMGWVTRANLAPFLRGQV